MKKSFLQLSAVIGIYLIAALYKLSEIPGEWYGDITALQSQVSEILKGSFPLGFLLGSGPLYPYFAAVFVKFLGVSYMTYKVATVSAGAVGLTLTYAYARELGGRRLAVVSGILLSVSSWYLAWARLGSTPVMATPVLSAGMMLCLLRYHRSGRVIWLGTGALLSGLGLFTYPGAYFYPLTYLAAFVILRLRTLINIRTAKELTVIALCLIPLITGFTRIVLSQPAQFLDKQGYLGAKLFPALSQDSNVVAAKLAANAAKTWGSFLFTGDIIFRTNVPGSPHLDPVSGVLFFTGILILLISRNQRKLVPFLIIPLLLIPVPSMSPALPDGEVPSITRTYGMLPFVVITAGIGILAAGEWVRKRTGKYHSQIVIGIIVITAAVFNLNKYFSQYPKSLPNRNSPYGRIIADNIDTLQPEMPVYMPGCCWGEWGQPEVHGVYYVLKNKTGRENIILDQYQLTCREIDTANGALIILDPGDKLKIGRFTYCFPGAAGQLHTDRYGQKVFYSLLVPPGIRGIDR